MLKRVYSFILSLALVFTLMPMNVEAANPATSPTVYAPADFATAYNEIMQSSASEYFISAQPDDALILNSNISITHADQTDNYTSGVINLPRLTAPYYYEISELNQMAFSNVAEDYDLSVKRTLYPSLSWMKEIPANTTIKLSIMSEEAAGAVKSFEMTFTDVMPAYSGATFMDCSSGLLDGIVQNDASSKVVGSTNCYPHALHKDSIVTSKFCVGFSANFKGHKAYLMSNVSLEEETGYGDAITFPYQSGDLFGTFSVKKAVAPYINGTMNGRPEFFACFEPSGTNCIYDANRGIVTTASTGAAYSASTAGFYCICIGTDLQWYRVASASYSGDLTAKDLNAHVVTLPNGDDVDLEDTLGHYGFEHCIDAINNRSTEAVFNTEDYPEVSYIGATTQTFNLYRTALAYGGVQPNVATLQGEKPIEKYTVNYYYRTSETEQYKLLDSAEVVVGQQPDLTVKPETYVALYTFDKWYTDQSHTTAASSQTIANNAKAGDVIQLYGKYNYTGGTYDVQFYNDYSQETTSATFETRNQPTLPAAPTRPGYLFRNWQIVSTTAQSSGTPYDASTFNPQGGVKYLFKTFWDTQGVITNVVSNQQEYYVGDYIDKSKLVVTVQTDNEGTVRTLNKDEFTVSPDKMESSGSNQFQVIYNATGATYPLKLTGKEVTALSISAKYNGGEITVGNTIPKSDIAVTVHYNNQTTEAVTDFTIAPSTVVNAGGNTVRVLYGSLSTTVSVPGIKKTTSSPIGNIAKPTLSPTYGTGGTGTTGGTGIIGGTGTTGNLTAQASKTLRSIKATYRGAQPYVGDDLRASDISVTATYLDNTTSTVGSTAFQYSPSRMLTPGLNTVLVSYGGKTTTFTVDVLEASDVTESPGSSNGVIGVDANGNPIYANATPTPVKVVSTGSAVTSNGGNKLGNPLTGAGMSSSDKGTSVGYLNGNNILTNRLYGSSTSVVNDKDILSEIRAAGDTATSVTVDLYNGAGGNEITEEMLTVLAAKDLTLYLNMINPDVKTKSVAKWVIYGDALDGTATGFNPNVSFEVTDKGSDILTYMAVLDGEYPNQAELTVYPAIETYASGEVIRVYSCGFDKSNTHLEKSFTWNDVQNEVVFDLAVNKRYCLSNALGAYPEGSSLTEDISLPSMEEEAPTTEPTIENTEEEPFDWGEEEEPFDWDTPVEPEEKESGFPWIVIPIGLVVVALGVTGVILFKKLRNPTFEEDYDDYEADDSEYDEEYGEDDDDVHNEEEPYEDDEIIEPTDDLED